MSIRAKFVVTSHTDYGAAYKTVTLECRYDTTIPEDRRFYDATPYGKIEMTVNNPAALEQLQIGAAFYVDFTPLPKAD